MSTWFEKGVFYHMYPLGMTGAPTGNTEAPTIHRFDELKEWIPHIQSLGCNAIYIGPLFESSSHGYDTRDFRLVDRRLGDNDDFASFVHQCHQAHIQVVVDGVFNHTGRDFFAFKDIQTKGPSSPYIHWYRGVNFHECSPFGDAFGYDAWQGHYELPCLNLENPEVKQYLFDVVKFWIDTYHIDGIRLDCANVLDFSFMKELRLQTQQMKEHFWLMGEVIHGDYSRWANDETLHSVTNYELHKSLYSGLNDHNCFEIAHNVRRLEAIAPRLYTFLDNHDENRIASKLHKKEHLIPAYLLLLTLPGIPSIYYGGEWGVEGMRTKESDASLRPCIPIHQTDQLHCELTDFIASAAQIHDAESAFHGGRYQELYLTNRQYAFARFGHNTTLLIAVNIDDKDVSIGIPLPAASSTAMNLMDGSILPVEHGALTLTIPSNSGIVLKIREE